MSLFKARPRVQFSGVITYDEGNDQWYVLLNSAASLTGYNDFTVYDSGETMYVWLRDPDNAHWASGIGYWEVDGGTSEERLYFATFDYDLSALNGVGVSNVLCTVGPIISGAPFFGASAKVLGYTLYDTMTYIAAAEWDAVAQGPVAQYLNSNGKFGIPDYAGAFRYSIDVTIDDTSVTDGTKFYVLMYLSDSEDPDVSVFSLTDVSETVGSIYCKKRFRVVSPIILANGNDYVRPRFFHDDTNANGLTASINFSVEFFPGDKNAAATDIPPPV